LSEIQSIINVFCPIRKGELGDTGVSLLANYFLCYMIVSFNF